MDLVWLEGLAPLVPGAAVTRWLLITDAACLVALGLAARRPAITIPVALGGGFLAVNALGMLVTDFFLGLALFHLAVGLVTLVVLRDARWMGAGALLLSAVLGIVT
ncbi:MAG: hypothetical protein HY615_07640 [Candidatus Rokubacteria bacterium]|nr:hypothetical protein [Candidatus Rokubacteria bacterium]